MQQGYYRLVKPYKSDRMEKGTLFYLIPAAGGSVKVIRHGSEWTVDGESVEDHFEYAPGGEQDRQRQVLDIMSDMASIEHRQDKFATALPALPAPPGLKEEGPELPGGPPVVTGGPLVSIPGREAAQAAALKVKKIKSSLALTRAMMVKRQQELQCLLKEKQLILAAKAAELEEQMDEATQAIYMINCYLGADEELVRIRKGKTAPAETPVVVRQLILFMDEEVAAAEEWAGRSDFDFKNVEDFDKWVIQPAHLQQVLPEQKGIIAIKPRRSSKFYSDNPFVNSDLNRANKCLYLLIRNGDLLYRVYTSLWLDDVLFPRRDEFEDCFYEEEYDHDRGKNVRKPMRPGGREYMKAMKSARAQRRRFYTVLLLLQGIIDRTKILKPMPVEHVNVCNIHEQSRYFNFLTDAENLLTCGRPTFNEWLANANAQLDVGCRVVGKFSPGYNSDQYEMHYTEKRVRPARAVHPKNDKIYTLESREGDRFVFRYAREGDTAHSGWDDWRGHDPKHRAAFFVKRSDRFVINLDAVTTEEMEYYVHSRINRHDYATMLPLLLRAIAAKNREAAEEDPFRQLLVGRIMSEYAVTRERAEGRITTLIDWWKFKNRTHRALKEDDAKALRMIVKEFGVREAMDESKGERSGADHALVQAVLGRRQNVLAVFRRPDGDYTVYRTCNDQDVFVNEELWQEKDGEAVLVKEKWWVSVDNRFLRWLKLWAADRWEKWQVSVRDTNHLHANDIEAGLQFLLAAMKNRRTELSQDWTRKKHKGEPWMVPLVLIGHGRELLLYCAGTHSTYDTSRSLSGCVERPTVYKLWTRWEKNRDGIEFGQTHVNQYTPRKLGRHDPWNPDTFGKERILQVFDENVRAIKEEWAKVDELMEQRSRLARPGWNAAKQVQNYRLGLWYEEQHKAFLEEYEDDDEGTLWEMHKEKLDEPRDLWAGWVSDAADYLLEQGKSLEGLTVEALVREARKYGFKLPAHNKEVFETVKHVVLKHEDDKDDD